MSVAHARLARTADPRIQAFILGSSRGSSWQCVASSENTTGQRPQDVTRIVTLVYKGMEGGSQIQSFHLRRRLHGPVGPLHRRPTEKTEV